MEIRKETADLPGYLVLYDGYGNTDWVFHVDIISASSEDVQQEARMDSAPEDSPVKQNITKSNKIKKDRTSRKGPSSSSQANNFDRPHPTIPTIAPPPPSVLGGLSVPDEAEALSSMLMSWYMSGYHTGYYQAVKDMNSKK